MSSSKSLISLYIAVSSKLGPVLAKNCVSDTVYNAISDLQEKGLPVTEDSLDKILSEKTLEFIEASKNSVA